MAMTTTAETGNPGATQVAPRFGKAKPSILSIFERQRRQALVWFLVAVSAWAFAIWDR